MAANDKNTKVVTNNPNMQTGDPFTNNPNGDDTFVGGGDYASRIGEDAYINPLDPNLQENKDMDQQAVSSYRNAIGQQGAVYTSNSDPSNGNSSAQAQESEKISGINFMQANREQDSSGNLAGTNIIGMPLGFSPVDDVHRRVYRETFEQDLPVIWLNPGTARMNLALFGTSADQGNSFNLLNAGMKMVDAAFQLYNVATYPGNRFLNFKANYAEYYKYVQNMAMNLYQDMGLNGNFSFGDYTADNVSIYGIPFYALGDGTSISESASNSYQQSSIGSNVNQKQAEKREAKQLAGISSLADKIKYGIADLIKDVTTNIPIFGGVVGAFVEALDGDNMIYPQMWSDSTFDRSYDLQFEFYSPYGDPDSIFRYVYLPFLSLLTFALPLQDGFYSYKAPFLVRAFSPGWFECECGVVTSMSITRGDESMWTVDGFPRSIKISMSITDLYPSLIATKNPRKMKYNIGLTSFIETMSGLRYDQIDEIKRKGIKLRKLENRKSEIESMNWLSNRYGDFKYNKQMKHTNRFLR